jgi:hypothetical protein
MGRTFRRNDSYSYKNDYRPRNEKQLKKLNKKLQKGIGKKLPPIPTREDEGLI